MAEPYYRMTASEALSCLDASADGLSDEQATGTRLEAHGPNQLAEGKKKKRRLWSFSTNSKTCSW